MKSRQPVYLGVCTFVLLVFQSLAQNVNVAGFFPTLDLSGDLSNKVELNLYYFVAFPVVDFGKKQADPNFYLLYAEQALTLKPTKKFSLTASYVYQRSDVVYPNYQNENRFYLQAKYKHTLANLSLTHRLRWDGRFIENRATRTWPFTHRLRYLLGCEVPLGSKSYFSAYEEAFFNTFENPGAVFAENWAYAAIGDKLNQNNKLEMGILYVTWNIGENRWFNQYYLQFTWISRLAYKKQKQ